MSQNYQASKFLVIQTAFIGDVILATALVEKLHQYYPNAKIDFLVRKGNESIFENHPFINKILIWDKKKDKLKNLFKILGEIRTSKYEYVINCQRFFSTGILTAFSSATHIIGFDKNPLSFLFTKRVKHTFEGLHETTRNQMLIESITDNITSKPKIYPQENSTFKTQNSKFITISPASVWFTKQYPKEKWIEFMNSVSNNFEIVLLGGANDKALCEEIKKGVLKPSRVCVLAGRLSLLESAAIMQDAKLNYVNDSAPMHLCSAVNASVCVVYCSTVSEFGYGPLSDFSRIVQVEESLACRPCGIHGHKACPEGHFKCAVDISTNTLLSYISK